MCHYIEYKNMAVNDIGDVVNILSIPRKKLVIDKHYTEVLECDCLCCLDIEATLRQNGYRFKKSEDGDYKAWKTTKNKINNERNTITLMKHGKEAIEKNYRISNLLERQRGKTCRSCIFAIDNEKKEMECHQIKFKSKRLVVGKKNTCDKWQDI